MRRTDRGLIVVEVRVDQTDDQIKEIMRVTNDAVLKASKGAFLVIPGYDSDPREIWEIPECIELCKKLCRMGFLTLLDANVLHKHAPPGLPGFQVWQIAQDVNIGVDHLITKKITDEFFADLMKSNVRCDAICA